MKKIFGLLMLVLISIDNNAQNQVKGELRTEINGFQWYCYKNKEAYTLDGRKLFTDIKSQDPLFLGDVKKVTYLVADKEDKGNFLIQEKGYIGLITDNDGRKITRVWRGDDKDLYIKKLAITFQNPYHKEYFFLQQFCVKQMNRSYFRMFSNSGVDMGYTKGVVGSFTSYKVINNFILFTYEYSPYDMFVTNYDGKQIIAPGLYNNIEFVEKANHFVCSKKNNKAIIDINGKTIIDNFSTVKYKNEGKFAEVVAGTNKGLLSFSGKWIVPIDRGYDNYTHIYGYGINSNEFFIVKYKDTSKYNFISANGTDIMGKDYDNVFISNYCIKVKYNESYGIFAPDGRELIPVSRGYTYISDFDSKKRTFAYTMNGYKGECDGKGKQISKIKVETPQQAVASSSSTTYRDCMTFDLIGNVKKGQSSFLGTTLEFDRNGKLIAPKNRKIIYDNKGRVSEIKSTDAGITDSGFKYEYDNNGRVNVIISFFSIFDEKAELRTQFFYNNTGQIVKEIGTTSKAEDTTIYSDYTFDSHGNWISRKKDGKLETRSIEYY